MKIGFVRLKKFNHSVIRISRASEQFDTINGTFAEKRFFFCYSFDTITKDLVVLNSANKYRWWRFDYGGERFIEV
jgi:hypothetical protein